MWAFSWFLALNLHNCSSETKKKQKIETENLLKSQESVKKLYFVLSSNVEDAVFHNSPKRSFCFDLSVPQRNTHTLII